MTRWQHTWMLERPARLVVPSIEDNVPIQSFGVRTKAGDNPRDRENQQQTWVKTHMCHWAVQRTLRCGFRRVSKLKIRATPTGNSALQRSRSDFRSTLNVRRSWRIAEKRLSARRKCPVQCLVDTLEWDQIRCDS